MPRACIWVTIEYPKIKNLSYLAERVGFLGALTFSETVASTGTMTGTEVAMIDLGVGLEVGLGNVWLLVVG